jgi:SHS2 domain-containing protein
MVENLSAIRDRTEITRSLSADSAEMLLFQLLQEIVFYKDARQLLLRVKKARIEQEDGSFLLHCTLCGERIDRERHDMLVDVKAVTLYRYRVEKTSRGYRATVVLDV